MKNYTVFCAAAALSLLFLLTGCRTKDDFVYKSEKELEAMEQVAVHGSTYFSGKQYANSKEIFDSLSKERTVSQGLYNRENISVLLMQGKYDEAHQLMLKAKEELDTLTDKKSAKKAKSLWHGEVNKVYKGDPYERCSLHALLAMSFLRQGDAENALVCVKGGLLYDADTEKQEYTADYALLHYLGALAANKLNDEKTAEQYRDQALTALSQRPLALQADGDGVKDEGTVFAELASKETADQANTLLVFWAGSSPSISLYGEYKENRLVSPGYMSLDSMTITLDDSSEEILLPRYLADLNFQALTRGQSLINEIVKRKGAWKKTFTVVATVCVIAGTAMVAYGLSARQYYVAAAGGATIAVGVICWIVAKCINPKADARYWKNLPSEFVVKPLRLTPGKHTVRLNGYYGNDFYRSQEYEIDVRPDLPLNVIHLHAINPIGHNIAHGLSGRTQQETKMTQLEIAKSIIPSQYMINVMNYHKNVRHIAAGLAASATSPMEFEIPVKHWNLKSAQETSAAGVVQKAHARNMFTKTWEE